MNQLLASAFFLLLVSKFARSDDMFDTVPADFLGEEDMARQIFEERAKDFILRAHRRFQVKQKKRPDDGFYGEIAASKDEKENMNKIRVAREAPADAANFTTMELSNPFEGWYQKVKEQSSNLTEVISKEFKGLGEKLSGTWDKLKESAKEGARGVQEKTSQFGKDLEARWDSMKGAASERFNSTMKSGLESVASELTPVQTEKEEKKEGFLDRLRKLLPSRRR